MNRNLSADQFTYVPVESSHIDSLDLGEGKRFTYHDKDPGDPTQGIVNKSIEAQHPETGEVVGAATWRSWPKGNLTVEVDPRYQERGIGTRLALEAKDVDASSWENMTPVTRGGQALVNRLQR